MTAREWIDGEEAKGCVDMPVIALTRELLVYFGMLAFERGRAQGIREAREIVYGKEAQDGQD